MMQTQYGTVPVQCYTQVQWQDREEELWNGVQLFPQPLPIPQEVKPMYRYLSEPDQPWFIPRTHEDGSLDMMYQAPLYSSTSTYLYQEPSQYPRPIPYQHTSPSMACLSSPSMYNDSNDGRSISSSPPSTPHYSPEVVYHDSSSAVPLGGMIGIKQEQLCAGECVALNEIQTYADAVADEYQTFESEPLHCYTLNVQEGYQPLPMDHCHHSSTQVHNNAAVPISPDRRPNFRRRQAPEARSISSSTGSRISKRTSERKRNSTVKPEPETYPTVPAISSLGRAFPCPFALYGCPSSFGSKNEWKRHINTQHMRLSFWRCDLCDQTSRKPNDFNRKDLFIQHVRRMHPKTPGASTAKSIAKKSGLHTRPSKSDPYEQELIAIAQRCFQNTRPSPDQSGCLFCEEIFAGCGSWDDRLEHIGKHMELMKKGGEGLESSSTMLNCRYWKPDPELEEWLEEAEIIVHDGQGYVLAEDVRG